MKDQTHETLQSHTFYNNSETAEHLDKLSTIDLQPTQISEYGT